MWESKRVVKGGAHLEGPGQKATHIVHPHAARGAECQTTTAPVAAPCALLNRTPVVFVGRVSSDLSRTSHPSVEKQSVWNHFQRRPHTVSPAGGNTYSYDAKARLVHFALNFPARSVPEMGASLANAY